MESSLEIFSSKKRKLIGLGVFIFLVICFFIYYSLLKEIKNASLEYKKLKKEVEGLYKTLSAEKGNRKKLIKEEKISFFLKEIVKKGKGEGIEFISITPKKIEEILTYRVLPIEMWLESSYKSLGTFLGFLNSLEEIIKVESFEISPLKNNPSKLKTNLLIKVYLAEK
jgi:Tfp pilus assembly protein PilO